MIKVQEDVQGPADKIAEQRAEESHHNADQPVEDAPDQEMEPVDAVVSVRVSQDELEAYIHIQPPQYGGADPTLYDMRSMLEKNGITQYIVEDKLRYLAADLAYDQDVLVARGVAPMHGEDGVVEYLFKTDEVDLTPMAENDGRVDYRALDWLQNVNKGQVLCQVTLPTIGETGVSVKGNVLTQKRGRPAPVGLGSNVEYNEDKTEIIAKVSGQVALEGVNVTVHDTLYIKGDIDYATGNIDVPNNVMIYGRILPGFKIISGGNVEIKDVVEGAEIKAQGDVVFKAGVTHSTVECEGKLQCRYIDNCTMKVKGDVQTKSISNSKIHCHETIEVVGSQGRIVGGEYIAGKDIIAHTIGSVANVDTHLELSANLTAQQRCVELEDVINTVREQNRKIEPVINLHKQLQRTGKLSSDREQTLRELMKVFKNNQAILQSSQVELGEVKKALAFNDVGRIICHGFAYPGAEIVIGVGKLYLRKAMRNVSFYYESGSISTSMAR